MREGGSEMIKLNTEIRNLSEEIQAKRYELLEEEEVWLHRNLSINILLEKNEKRRRIEKLYVLYKSLY